jgi:P pilus assembly chaperone PapD
MELASLVNKLSPRIASVSHGSGLLLVFLAGTLILPKLAYAAPQLIVAPTRIIIEGRTRTASVNLINRGDETGTFRIKFERKRMTETGRVVPMEKPAAGEVFADQMIRYAPRQVTLAPGQSQVVRLMVRKPANLADGEYRSHLLFQGVPPDAGKSIQSQTAPGNNKLSIEIIPVLGVSIPVIVRHGKTSASVTIDNLQLENRSRDGKKANLVLRANRNGNQSVYGDFTVYFTPKRGGKKLMVSQVSGAAIYTPNNVRIVTLPLQAPNGVKLDAGTIEVVYQEPPSKGQKVLASATARIAPLGR